MGLIEGYVRRVYMKKIIAAALCLCFAFAFTACGGDGRFDEYTKYLGGDYSQMPADYAFYESELITDYVEFRGPREVSFDEAEGGLIYCGINANVKDYSHSEAAGKVITLSWMVKAGNNPGLNIKEHQGEMIKSLVKEYGEYDSLLLDTYTWHLKSGLKIEFVAGDDFYQISWSVEALEKYLE